MKNKIAVVTGGTSILGTEICRYFFSNHARVIATYHHSEDYQTSKTWQKEQRAKGCDIDIKYIDLNHFASCEKLVNEIENEYGAIDILVNSADVIRDLGLSDIKFSAWRDLIKTNLGSIFNLTYHVINGMNQRFYGRIINISSINSQPDATSLSNETNMHAFTKSLAREVGQKGITVNTVSPGYIESTMIMSVPDSLRNQIISQIPVGRLGRPEEIARAVGFLAAQASSFITGANLAINGGQY